MAITATALTADIDDSNATVYTTASISPTANRLQLAAVVISDTNPAGVPSLAGNSLTWVNIGSVEYDNAGTRRSVFLFRAMGASPTAGAVTITATEAVSGCGWAIAEFAGVDTSGSNGSGAIVGTPVTNTGNSTTLSATLPSFASANNGVAAALSTELDSVFTAGSGFSVLNQDVSASASPVQSIGLEWRADNDTSVDATVPSAGLWGIIAVELAAGGTALAGSSAGATSLVADLTVPVAVELAGSSTGRSAASAVPTRDRGDAAPAPFSWPLIETEVAFRSGPKATTPEWTDVSDKVTGFATKRGRQRELDRMEPGRYDGELDNSGREFDPSNTASPFAPNVVPNREMRTKAEWPYLPGLIANPTFDTDASGWEAVSGCTVARDATVGFGGTTSLQLTASGAGQLIARSTSASAPTVVADRSYVATLRFRPLSNGQRACFVRIDWLDASKTLISTVDGTQATSAVGVWTRCSVVGTAPATAAYARVVANVLGAAGAGEKHNVTAAVLWPATSLVAEEVFHGFSDKWPTSWTKRYGQARLRATDAFKVLAREKMLNPYHLEVLARSPVLWLPLDETAGPTAADQSGSGLDATYSSSGITYSQAEIFADGLYGAIVLDGSTSEIVVNPSASLEPPWSVVFWCGFNSTTDDLTIVEQVGTTPGRRWRIYVTGTATGKVRAELKDEASAGPQVTTSTTMNTNTTRMVAVTVDASNVMRIYVGSAASAPALEATDATGGAVLTAPASAIRIGAPAPGRSGGRYTGLLDAVAFYRSELSLSDLGRIWTAWGAWGTTFASGDQVRYLLDAIAWPSDSTHRDLDQGQSLMLPIDQPEADVLAQLLVLAESEGGAFYVDRAGRLVFRERHAILRAPYTTVQATLGDGDGELPYEAIELDEDETRVRNDVTATRRAANTDNANATPEVKAVARDATSIDMYGRRSYDRRVDVVSSTEPTDAANWILAHNKDPDVEVPMVELNPASDPALWEHILRRELEDRIRVVARPPGGGLPVVKEMLIQGIEHEVAADPQQWITRWWLSPADTQPYLILDDPVYGVLDRSRPAY